MLNYSLQDYKVNGVDDKEQFESNDVNDAQIYRPKLKMSDFNISSNKSSFIRNDFDIKYDNKGSFLNVMNKDSNNNIQ